MTRGTIISSVGACAILTLLGLALFYCKEPFGLLCFMSALGFALGYTIFIQDKREIYKFWGKFRNSISLLSFRQQYHLSENIPEISVNAEGFVTYISPAASMIINVRTIDLPISLDAVFGGLGQDAKSLCHSLVRRGAKLPPSIALAEHAPNERHVQISWLPAKDGVSERSAIVTDATELKSLETQLLQGHKMQAIGQLAGGIAHDFNNLLTAISGYCDLMMLGKTNKDPDYEYLLQISDNAVRAGDLVQHLLAFSRRQRLRPSMIDVNDLVSQLSTLLNRLVGEKIDLVFDPAPELQSVQADMRQLEQVIMNLVVNARDAMPEGGKIEIKTRNVDLSTGWKQDGINVVPGKYVLIEVRDNGVGITPEQASKVFEPFFTTKKTGEGTGLGLSTVYGIVKQSGGYIFVESQKGQGANFTIYFPAFDVKPLESEATQAAPTFGGFGLADISVLLVEDEDPVRTFAARALSLQGVIVTEAASGEEALEIISAGNYRPDIVVSDIVMPGMNGPDWVKKARETYPDLRVIFVSGYSEDVIEDGGLNYRHDSFLAKPYSLSALIEAVQSEVNSSGHARKYDSRL